MIYEDERPVQPHLRSWLTHYRPSTFQNWKLIPHGLTEGPEAPQHRSTATPSAGNDLDNLPPNSDLPQRPRATSSPRVRIEESAGQPDRCKRPVSGSGSGAMARVLSDVLCRMRAEADRASSVGAGQDMFEADL